MAPEGREATLVPASSLPLQNVHDPGNREALQAGQKPSCPLLGAQARDGFQVSGGLNFLQCHV